MARAASRQEKRIQKHRRIRARLLGSASLPRVCLFKSNRSIYLQAVDDSANRTLFSLSTLRSNLSNTISGAKSLAEMFADRLLALGLERIKFDRSGYIYHGKVAAIAESLRAKGISF